MKILLILPAAQHVRVARQGDAVPRRKMLRFSVLPLTTVAALTPSGHEVLLCDENVEPVDLNTDADVIGISVMTATALRGYALAQHFRSRGKTVVAGGYHATLCPEEVAEHFDAVVIGEAELLWPRVLQDVAAHRLQRYYRHDRPVPPQSIPIPRRDLLTRNARHYATIHAVQTARGCVHGCRYCSIAAFHRRSYRHRPIAAVVNEVKALPRHFMFVDDNLVADAEYTRELLHALKPLKKRWICQCSIEIADDPELLHLAYEAGCRGLFIGIESLNHSDLTSVGKEFNRAAEYDRQLASIRRAGIGVQAGVILGMDGDDVGVFRRVLTFLQRTRISAVQVNILTPLPGTPLFDDYERAGRITRRDWSVYDFRHTVIRPKGMQAQDLQDGADWLYCEFYRLDRILLRAVRDLWSLGPLVAMLTLRLNLTYRYDNIRERLRGRDPAKARWEDWFAKWRLPRPVTV